MAQPWKIIESIATEEGVLELRQRGSRDFLIMIGSQVLMNSLANRSEVALGRLGCLRLKDHASPRVLIGGLGMPLAASVAGVRAKALSPGPVLARNIPSHTND